MLSKLKEWWEDRRIARAQALIESYGLSVVKIVERAGTTYFVHPDGSYLKLTKGKK